MTTRSDAADRRGARRIAAAIGVGIVALGGSATLLAASSPGRVTAQPAAAAFLPPNGKAQWIEYDAGAAQQWEHWITGSLQPVFALPEQAGELVLEEAAQAGGEAQHWMALGTDEPSGAPPTAAERELDLYTVTDAGISLMVRVDVDSGLTFRPGVLVLDPRAQPGTSWQTSGEVVSAFENEGEQLSLSLRYESEHVGREPTDVDLLTQRDDTTGCLEVEGTLSFFADGESTPAASITETSLWCRGEGVVATKSTIDRGATHSFTRAVDSPVLAEAFTNDAVPVDPASWTASTTPVIFPHPVYGPTRRWLSPAVEPVPFGDMLAIPLDYNAGISFVRAIDDELHEVRLAQPGGQVTALGRSGDLIVATTASRRVVAYRPDGVRLWEADLDDIAVAPPLADESGNAIVATVDGVVRSFTPSGELRWRAAHTPDAIEFLLRVGDLIVVIDRLGRSSALWVADGAPAWSESGPVVAAARASDDAVYLARNERVQRLDAAAGHIEWSTLIYTSVFDLVVIEDTVVVLSDGGVLGLDASTGDLLWAEPGAERITAIDDLVLVDGDDAVRLLRADGSEAARWSDVPTDATIYSGFMVADAFSAWITTGMAGITRIAP